MNIIKKIRPGEMLPAWYGIAWREWDQDMTVCLPLGLNLICALARNLYYMVKLGGLPVPINPRDAYAQGLRDGRKAP